MTVGLSPVAGAGWQFFDANGVPLSGGRLYTYAAGTTTPQTTYTSSTGATPNQNPIELDSAGRVSGTTEVWLDITVAYKFILKTTDDVQLWSADDISGMAGIGNPLPVPSGGTGRATATAYAVICGGTTATGALQSIASVGTTGQVLTSNGVGALPTMQASFIAGMIILWSGSVLSIPTGWLLCDGTLSTPNLRDRFVVGAGSTYAVGATGGAADAVVVTHTHVATVTDPTHQHLGFGSSGATAQAGSGGGIGGAAGVLNTAASTGITVSNATPAGSVSGTNQNLPPYYALCYIMKS
jgi:hypothetical protein